MTSLEQEIMTEISQLAESSQVHVLNYIRHLKVETLSPTYTALELMQLPSLERDRLVAQAFALAADEEFEIFEADDEDDFDDYSNDQAR